MQGKNIICIYFYILAKYTWEMNSKIHAFHNNIKELKTLR